MSVNGISTNISSIKAGFHLAALAAPLCLCPRNTSAFALCKRKRRRHCLRFYCPKNKLLFSLKILGHGAKWWLLSEAAGCRQLSPPWLSQLHPLTFRAVWDPWGQLRLSGQTSGTLVAVLLASASATALKEELFGNSDKTSIRNLGYGFKAPITFC